MSCDWLNWLPTISTITSTPRSGAHFMFLQPIPTFTQGVISILGRQQGRGGQLIRSTPSRIPVGFTSRPAWGRSLRLTTGRIAAYFCPDDTTAINAHNSF
ncbi:hypothetical protein ACRALDRAFT_1065499 [Sodiomyces alcalophilus JCM 7366]|uniref:uncharacterized protein n=1 Tax=Sodiomyces alcalophilus JCM 7366 TaxID=591952 RepID=UPI0039B6351F